MPVSKAYRKQIVDMLQIVAPVTDRAMFGGVGIYCRGLFFAVIVDDHLYFKVDSTNRPDYDAEEMPAWSSGYRMVPRHVVDDAEELATWLEKAVMAAERKRKPK